MKFHLLQAGAIGRPVEIEAGMAGQRPDLYQRFLEEIRGYVRLADELGYASYGHNEHHLQIEGFEITNHPGMFSLYVGLHSKRLMAATLGYVLPTHNPVRVAEEIATLDHMLQGRHLVGFTRGFQARWVDSYAAFRGTTATTPDLARARDENDAMNREIFEESVRVVKTAWENETFSFSGKYWQYPPEIGSASHPAYETFGRGVGADGRVHEIGIAPRPYQTPHSKIYGAFAHSMRTIKMWAREGGKPIVMANDPDFCEALWTTYRATAAEAGRDVAPDDVAAWGGLLIITEDKDQAQQLYAQHRWFWDKWFIPFGQRFPNVLIGSADEVSRQIEEAHERLGFNEMWLQFGQGHLDPEQNHDELIAFAEKVAPRFADKDAAGTLV
ncbi:LLM class flavin-dependent oxidoreductase [Pseudonocardia xishanensis]|uniref:Luciferase-like domain-containing protein n=1 Tax=Pseudonocardia xishanensis TaxID=630995 RepID=A0ABP8RXG1_9PSEU